MNMKTLVFIVTQKPKTGWEDGSQTSQPASRNPCRGVSLRGSR